AQVKAAGSRLAWLPDARPAGSGRGRSEGWIPLVIYVDRGPLLEGCRLAARLLPARTPDPAGPHLLRARGSGYTLHAAGRGARPPRRRGGGGPPGGGCPAGGPGRGGPWRRPGRAWAVSGAGAAGGLWRGRPPARAGVRGGGPPSALAPRPRPGRRPPSPS